MKKEIKRRRYIAILTGIRRYTNRVVEPPLLLTRVFDLDTLEEYRDHVWVRPTKALLRNLPGSHEKKKTLVMFKAIPIEYLSSEGKKKGLQKVRHLQVLDRSFYSSQMDDYIEDLRKKKESNEDVQHVSKRVSSSRETESKSSTSL
jgi:hypothetical protein